MPSSHLILCRPLLLLPPIPPSIRVFSNESTPHMRWPKYWSFSFSISPSNEHPGLISFRMDWLDLLAVLGTLKSLLQHHSSKASILWCSAFFTVQLSYPYMTTRKTTALTRRTFVGKVTSLLFNMLPRLVITFLPRSKHLWRSRKHQTGKVSGCLGALRMRKKGWTWASQGTFQGSEPILYETGVVGAWHSVFVQRPRISTVNFIDIDSIKSGNKCTTLTQKMLTLEMPCRRWENGTLCTVC